MYSRSFYPAEASSPPENYSGTAFTEPAPIFEAQAPEPPPAEPVYSSTNAEVRQEKSEDASPAGLFGLPFLSGLARGGSCGSFGSLGNLFSSIGIEEILIIAVAAFLFFSKDGDNECAILLILLLFVK